MHFISQIERLKGFQLRIIDLYFREMKINKKAFKSYDLKASYVVGVAGCRTDIIK